MITGLRTFGPVRLPLVGVALLAAIAWAVVTMFVHTGASNEPTPAGTHEQIAAAQQFLATLPAVSGTTLDRYDTACREPHSYCLTSSSLTPRQLMPKALAMLKTHGLKVDKRRCAKHNDGLPECAATLHWQGTRLVLASDAQPRPGDETGPNTLVVKVDQIHVERTPGGTPLPSWSVLNPFPTAWGIDPACAGRERGRLPDLPPAR